MSGTQIIDRKRLLAAARQAEPLSPLPAESHTLGQKRPLRFNDETQISERPAKRAPYWADDETEIGLPPSRLAFDFLVEPDASDVPPPAAPSPLRRGWRKIHAEFAKTPRSVRYAFFALPLLAIVSLWDDAPEPRRAAQPSRPAAELSEKAMPAPVRAEPSAPASAAAAHPLNKPAKARAGAGPTLEARAVSELERGNLVAAATLYEQLANEMPDRPVFATAARILRQEQSLDGGR